MRTTSIVAVLLLLPFGGSAAERVAVLPISYTIYKTNSPSEERALKVSDAVAAGVERAGLEPVRGDDVISASRELAAEGSEYCDQPACAREVADRVGALFGIIVSVVDKDGQFEIEVLGTDSEPISASPFGTFRSMTRRVSGLVETSVRDAIAIHGVHRTDGAVPAEPSDEEPIPEAETTVSDSSAENRTEEQRVVPSEGTDDGISPVPFIVSAVVTGGVAAGWVAVEAVGYTKTKDAVNKSKYTSLQTGARVLLGCAAAGLVTSVVLFVLTDFNADEAGTAHTARRWNLSPAPIQGGGALVLEGRF